MAANKTGKSIATAVEACSSFTDYYQSLGYNIIPGSSLLDPAVPMAFVMSAGLAQVESSAKLIDGRSGSKYTLVQNCFRYFDLKNVGLSPYHLSLFQMPGAFTFGEHAKASDIHQTMRLLTDVFGFAKERLWATFFSGDVVEGIELAPDKETADAWAYEGIPEKQIVGLGADQNFWKQNANFVGKNHAAKCGPNTEVFLDKDSSLQCSQNCQPGCGCGRFVEITNTLFITYSIEEHSRTVVPLDNPFTETLIGAERVTMLLQGMDTVFQTHGLAPLVKRVQNRADSGIRPHSQPESICHDHIIADHIRAILFLAADGAPPPGKGGRARLMRKLIRELLISSQLLGIHDKPFLPDLVDAVIQLHSKAHPKVSDAGAKALLYINDESSRFEKTLFRGYRRLERLITARQDGSISGRELLTLEKQYGVPVSLIDRKLEQWRIDYSPDEYNTAYRDWEANISGNKAN